MPPWLRKTYDPRMLSCGVFLGKLSRTQRLPWCRQTVGKGTVLTGSVAAGLGAQASSGLLSEVTSISRPQLHHLENGIMPILWVISRTG